MTRIPADLGANAGSDAARNEQRCDQGTGLADHCYREPRRDQSLGAEARQRGAGVHRHHNAHGKSGQADERAGVEADLLDLARRFADFERRPEDAPERGRGERGPIAELP